MDGRIQGIILDFCVKYKFFEGLKKLRNGLSYIFHAINVNLNICFPTSLFGHTFALVAS